MSIESEIAIWLSVAKGMNESLADVIRHDQDHDNWHKMHGDAPCTSEADCAQKRAKYAEVQAEVTKGDVVGHEFHGNQYSSGAEAADRAKAISGKVGTGVFRSNVAAREHWDISNLHDKQKRELDELNQKVLPTSGESFFSSGSKTYKLKAEARSAIAKAVEAANTAKKDHLNAMFAHQDTTRTWAATKDKAIDSTKKAEDSSATALTAEKAAREAVDKVDRLLATVRTNPTGIQSEQSEMRHPEPTPTPNANKFSHPYQVQYSTPSSLTAAAQTLVNNHLKVDSSGNTPQDLNALALEHEKIAANLRNVAASQSAPPTNSNRQDPDEGEKLQGNSYWRRGNNQRPDGVTANDASSTYSPASASTGDRGRNIISGTTSNRLEDFRLAATSMTKLADPDHGFASTRVRGELGSIREAIQDRITDLKNEALAGGSKFTKGGGNNPTRSAADYKDLISKLTSASSAVGALRSGFRGSTRDDNGNAVANSTHYMASGEYAKDAPKAQAKVDAALQAYDDFYKGTDGNPTGYFDNDKFKKSVSQA